MSRLAEVALTLILLVIVLAICCFVGLVLLGVIQAIALAAGGLTAIFAGGLSLA